MIMRIQGVQGSRTAGGVKGIEVKALESLNPRTLGPYFLYIHRGPKKKLNKKIHDRRNNPIQNMSQ
jgi:hypothetical protein